MKIFYSAEDIENFADQGQREIYIDENVVLTDLAKQTAQMLGMRITAKPSGPPSGAFNTTRRQSAVQKHTSGGKPKGCQRRPAEIPVPASGPSRPVVDKLVEKIKRISGKKL